MVEISFDKLYLLSAIGDIIVNHSLYTNLKLGANSLVDLEGLSHGQIQHNLLGSTGDGVGSDLSVQSLNLTSETASGVGKTTKDLGSLSGTQLEGLGGLGLATSNGTTKSKHGLLLGEHLALEDQVLEPGVGGLDSNGHVGELGSDDGVLNQRLAESLSLVGVLAGLLVANSRSSVCLDDDTNSLVVEVGHDDLETLVLLAEQVLHGDLDILHGDPGRAGRQHTLSVHSSGLKTLHASLEQQNRDTVHARAGATGSDGNSEVVSPDTVGDPLLDTVDNVELSVGGLLGGSGDVGNIGASVGLSDTQTDSLGTVEQAGEDSLLKGLLGELDHGRQTNTVATKQVPGETSGASSHDLVGDDELVEHVVLLNGHRGGLDVGVLGQLLVGGAERAGKVTSLAHLLEDLLGNLLLLIPFLNEGLNLLLNPLSDLVTQLGVGLLVVGVVVAVVPVGVGVGDKVSVGLEGGGLVRGNHGSSGVCFSVFKGSDLELVSNLSHNLGGVVVFVEKLGSVFSCDSFENLFSAGVFFLEFGEVENVTVNDDPQRFGRVVLRNLLSLALYIYT